MMHHTPTQIHELLARALPHITDTRVFELVSDYLVTGSQYRFYAAPGLRGLDNRALDLAVHATKVHRDGMPFYRSALQSSFDNLTNILNRRAAR